MTTVGGIVLCGGESKRMGSPKAWLPFGDELLLPRVVRLLSEVVAPIVVVAAPDQELPPLQEVQIVRDAEKGRGPLQGLAAGLHALQGQVEAAFVSSCDAPFLRPAFVRRMIEFLGQQQICVPRAGEYHHPLAAVYRVEVLAAVENLLEHDRLRPVFLFETLRTRVVEADELVQVDPHLRSLRNVNTPEEYEQALRELRQNP